MNISKDELSDNERVRTLQTRTATCLRVAVVQQVILVVLLAQAYFSWDNGSRLDALEAKLRKLDEGVRVGESEPWPNRFGARLDDLELGRIKHDARLEVLERGTANHAYETRETLRQLSVAVADTRSQPSNMQRTTAQPHIHERRLQAAQNDDRAIIRVDAPDGRAQFVMGAKAAADNVIMEKEHADEGGDFTLSRNLTRVLGIGVDGGVTVHTDPLNVASMLRSAVGSPLHLQGHDGVNMQSKSSFSVRELDGQGKWSTQSLKVYVGDTIEWTWTNYHNVIETDTAGSIKAGGISSGAPKLASTFQHTFDTAGTYRFKSQAQYTMTCTVEVIESFVLKDGKVKIGGDLEVGGSTIAGAGFESEIKMFLGNECPTGWTEATELGGYFLMGRASGGQVNATKNRPMGASEDGRMHSTYYKGHQSWGNYDDRYFGGYYTSYGSSSAHRCTSSSCSYCRLPGSSSNVDCDQNFGGQYQWKDYYYSDNSPSYFRWDKLTNPAYQTSTYMAPIGEYYPFASVLLCKRA